MSKHVRPSIIGQRTFSILTGRPRPVVRNYGAIDPSTVARPVGIGSVHVHAAAIVAANARIHTTAQIREQQAVAAQMLARADAVVGYVRGPQSTSELIDVGFMWSAEGN